MELFRLVEELAFRSEQVLKLRDAVRARMNQADPAQHAKLKAFADALESERGKLVSTKESGGAITGEERLREKLSNLYRNVLGQPGRPSPEQLNRFAVLRDELAATAQAIEALAARELPALNASAGAPDLFLETRASWDLRTTPK
jgi:hypothetical protein